MGMLFEEYAHDETEVWAWFFGIMGKLLLCYAHALGEGDGRGKCKMGDKSNKTY